MNPNLLNSPKINTLYSTVLTSSTSNPSKNQQKVSSLTTIRTRSKLQNKNPKPNNKTTSQRKGFYRCQWLCLSPGAVIACSEIERTNRETKEGRKEIGNKQKANQQKNREKIGALLENKEEKAKGKGG